MENGVLRHWNARPTFIAQMNADDFVLCAATVPQATLWERVDLAADAGFAGISVQAPDCIAAWAAGFADADLRAHLDDRGIRIAELDALVGWLPGATEPAHPAMRSPFGEREFYEVADALGARSLNVVDLCTGPMPPLDAAAAAFGGICDRAAEHDLLVHVEFVPWTRISSLTTAWEIVRMADRPNGGLLLDNWHLFNGGKTVAAVGAVPADRVLALQIRDASRLVGPRPALVARQHRLLPGQGDTDVAGLLGSLRSRGCAAPIGVEVVSPELAALPAAVATRDARDAIGGVVSRSRG
jgi:sugar phosphate isomerase/epimerase